MSRKTVYPYDVARADGSALFRSHLKPESIRVALYDYGKRHNEKWHAAYEPQPEETEVKGGKLYRLWMEKPE